MACPAPARFYPTRRNFTLHWVTPDDHAEATALFEQRNLRGLSLVDCMSFVVMRKYRSTTALAYDADFQAEGSTFSSSPRRDASRMRRPTA